MAIMPPGDDETDAPDAEEWRRFAMANSFQDVANCGSRIVRLVELDSNPSVKRYEIRSCRAKYVVDIDRSARSDYALIHAAAMCGNCDLCTDVLDAGADVDKAVINTRQTPLFVAVRAGHLNICELLLSRNARVNLQDELERTPFIDAVEKGDKKICQLLIRYGADTRVSWNGCAPIHLAIMAGHVNICKMLLNYTSCSISIFNCGFGGDLQYLAARTGHIDVCKWLLDKFGFDKDCRDCRGYTPLHYAALDAHRNINRRVAVDDEFSMSDRLYKTPRCLASSCDHSVICKLFAERGSDVECRTGIKETPLHLAARSGNLCGCRALLDFGANVDALDSLGRSPLFYAASGNHIDVCRLLIDGGASPRINTDYLGIKFSLSSHDWANTQTIWTMLVDAGADTPKLPQFEFLRNRTWGPTINRNYPVAFRCAIKTLVLCTIRPGSDIYGLDNLVLFNIISFLRGSDFKLK